MRKQSATRDNQQPTCGRIIVLSIIALVIMFFTIPPNVAYQNAKQYVKQKYSNIDYSIDYPYFVWYDGSGYHSDIHHPTNPDYDFSIYFNLFGIITSDSYTRDVIEGRNIKLRLEQEYDQKVTDLVSKLGNICYLEAQLIRTRGTDIWFHEQVLHVETNYDVGQLGEIYGNITVRIIVEKQTPNFYSAAKMLHEIDKALQEQKIGYQTLNLTLYYQEEFSKTCFYINDVTPDILHSENSNEKLWKLWQTQEQHRKDLRKK